MRPYYQDVVEQEFNNILEIHPEYNDTIDLVLESLRNHEGAEKEWFRDSIFQKPHNYLPYRIDAHFYAKLITLQCQGRLWWGAIDVGRLPVEQHQDRLLNEFTLLDLPAPFSVEFRPNGGEREGFLKWEEPVILEGGYAHGTFDKGKEVPPGSCPLEIGYIRALTTYLLLEEHSFIARWPFGYKTLFLLFLDAAA